MPKTYIDIIALVLLLAACFKQPEKPVTIAINPWPGYEFLYLAEQKGFFKTVDANIQLVQLGSLADAQRAYINGHTDGMASTIIEAVQANPLGGKPLQIVLIPDYSNGGDVIIAHKSITNMQALKGKKIGCEVSSLGIFVLQRALTQAGLTLADITVINTEQVQGEKALFNNEIDAFVGYPPATINILKNTQYHTLFTSADIPFEIIDTVSISTEVLEKKPFLARKIRQAWQMALDFSKQNPKEAYRIMSEREGINSEDFQSVLSDLIILDSKSQQDIFSQPEKLQNSVQAVCNTLVHVKSLNENCENYPNIVYQGDF